MGRGGDAPLFCNRTRQPGFSMWAGSGHEGMAKAGRGVAPFRRAHSGPFVYMQKVGSIGSGNVFRRIGHLALEYFKPCGQLLFSPIARTRRL